MVHAHYRLRGGEDESTELEAEMLRRHGHEVVTLYRNNRDLETISRGRVALQTVWNASTYNDVLGVIRDRRPDVVHLQNSFPSVSPSVILAAASRRVPVVQSLRNYRLLCLAATLFRNGQHCELCVGRPPLPGVRHGCYSGSRSASAVVASMLLVHRSLGTWTRGVARFIATSRYVREKYVSAGFAADAIAVKPNMIHPDPGVGAGEGDFVLYVGRLTEEKGLRTLINAWRRKACSGQLVIVGEGPLSGFVAEVAGSGLGIQWRGRQTLDATLDLMGRAKAVVVPSEWAEPFGRVVVESFARGTPVIAASAGALSELVQDGENGWLYEPGNVDELSTHLRAALVAENPRRMREAARQSFERHYTADVNYEVLREIYDSVVKEVSGPTLGA